MTQTLPAATTMTSSSESLGFFFCLGVRSFCRLFDFRGVDGCEPCSAIKVIITTAL